MVSVLQAPAGAPDVVTGFVRSVNEMVSAGTIVLPDLSLATSVLSVSDYSGQNNDARFQVISYLIVDWNNVGEWETRRLEFRRSKLGFERRMQFKKLNKDKERARLLPEYLQICGCINGLVLTFAIDKRVKYLFSTSSLHRNLEQLGVGSYAPHIAEQLIRVCHLQAPVVFALTRAGQKFCWITDKDPIAENTDGLGKLFGMVFDLYATHEFTEVGYARRFDNATRMFDDLLDIPDLVGGALLDLLHALEPATASPPIFQAARVMGKSDAILAWYLDKGRSLKTLLVVIEPKTQEGVLVRFPNLRREAGQTGEK